MGRYIGNNLRKLEDVITYLEQKLAESIILNVYYKKAFDSIHHNLIFKTFEHLNFGPFFINCIKTIYNNIQ